MTETIAIKKVKEYMDKNNLDIRRAAERFGVKESTLSRWIKGIEGNKRYPNPANQRKINKVIAPEEIYNEWIIEV